MIKAEVVFDENKIVFNGYEIDCDVEKNEYDVCLVDGGYIGSFKKQEDAIKYCLEQSYDPKTTD